jgi:hypothetical protein
MFHGNSATNTSQVIAVRCTRVSGSSSDEKEYHQYVHFNDCEFLSVEGSAAMTEQQTREVCFFLLL